MIGSCDSIGQRVFFSRAQVENGTAPLWLVNRKEQELLTGICKSGRYMPEQFTISGLRTWSKASAIQPPQLTQGARPQDLCRMAQKVFG
jgi:hypothetical protein